MTPREKLLAWADIEDQYVVTAGYVPPPNTPVVTPDMWKAMLDRVQALEATVRRLEQERAQVTPTR